MPLSNRNAICHSSGVGNQFQLTKIKMLAGNTRIGGSKEEFAPFLFQLLVADSHPRLVATTLRSLSLWSHCLLLSVCGKHPSAFFL